jgi:hypothetical protein
MTTEEIRAMMDRPCVIDAPHYFTKRRRFKQWRDLRAWAIMSHGEPV